MILIYTCLLVLVTTISKVTSDDGPENVCPTIQQIGTNTATSSTTFPILCAGMINTGRFILVTTDLQVFDVSIPFTGSVVQLITKLYLLSPAPLYRNWGALDADPRFGRLKSKHLATTVVVTDTDSSYWVLLTDDRSAAASLNGTTGDLTGLAYDIQHDQVLPGGVSLSLQDPGDSLTLVAVSTAEATLYGFRPHQGKGLQVAGFRFHRGSGGAKLLVRTEEYRQLCTMAGGSKIVRVAEPGSLCPVDSAPVYWKIHTGFIAYDQMYLFDVHSVYIVPSSVVTTENHHNTTESSSVPFTVKSYADFIVCKTELVTILVLVGSLLVFVWLLLAIWIYFCYSWVCCCLCTVCCPKGGDEESGKKNNDGRSAVSKNQKSLSNKVRNNNNSSSKKNNNQQAPSSKRKNQNRKNRVSQKSTKRASKKQNNNNNNNNTSSKRQQSSKK